MTRRAAVLLACVGGVCALGLVAAPAAGPGLSFAARNDYRVGLGPSSLAIGDLDGNGGPDLAVVDANDSLWILLNRGDGRFRKRLRYATGEPGGDAIADLNGDGKPDVAVAEWRAGLVAIFMNRGGGRLLPRVEYPVGSGAGVIAVGDLNGDGKSDLATSNFYDSTVSVLLNRGDGTFEPQLVYATGTRPESVAIADVNGDRKPDLATANLDEGTVSVLLNRGDGTFAPRVDYPTGARLESLALRDLNGDGKADVAALNEQGVSVLLNRGDGTFAAKRDYRVGLFTAALAIGDLNGDGRPDLAVTHQVNTLANVAVLLNDGRGSFEAKRDFPVGDEPDGLAIGHLDRNGLQDVATANEEARSVSILLNSTGRCGVPRVERRPLADAERAIVRHGCRVGQIRYARARLQRGRVVAQAPWAGRVLPEGSRVDLVVSLGS